MFIQLIRLSINRVSIEDALVDLKDIIVVGGTSVTFIGQRIKSIRKTYIYRIFTSITDKLNECRFRFSVRIRLRFRVFNNNWSSTCPVILLSENFETIKETLKLWDILFHILFVRYVFTYLKRNEVMFIIVFMFKKNKKWYLYNIINIIKFLNNKTIAFAHQTLEL